MRPRVLVLVLALIALTWAAAVAEARVAIGFEGGLRYGDAMGDDFGDPHPGAAWSLGLVGEAPMAGRWALVSGVRYVAHRDDVAIQVESPFAPGLMESYDVETSLHYVTVPLRLAFRPRSGLVLEAGGDAGYLLEGRTEVWEEGRFMSSSRRLRFARIFEELGTLGGGDLYEDWNVGFSAGAGWDFPWNDRVMTVRLRYEQGLTSLHASDVEQRYSRALALDAGMRW
jgi:hypothetical protein